MDWSLDVYGGHHPTHMENRGYSTGVGVERLGAHTQWDHRQPGHGLTGDSMEGGRGAYRHLSMLKSPVPWNTARVTGRKRNRDGYNAAESHTRACQCISRPLFLVFLDLKKAYDTVDRERLIQNLGVYGAGPRLCELLETFWARQKVVPR